MLLLSSPGYWSVGRVLWLIFGMGIALVLVIGASVPAQAAPSRTYAVTDSVTVGSNPAGVTAMPGGDVYVANYGADTVSVIDPTKDAVVDTVTGIDKPLAIAAIAAIAAMPGGDVYVTAGTLGGVGADASAVGD